MASGPEGRDGLGPIKKGDAGSVAYEPGLSIGDHMAFSSLLWETSAPLSLSLDLMVYTRTSLSAPDRGCRTAEAR